MSKTCVRLLAQPKEICSTRWRVSKVRDGGKERRRVVVGLVLPLKVASMSKLQAAFECAEEG